MAYYGRIGKNYRNSRITFRLSAPRILFALITQKACLIPANLVSITGNNNSSLMTGRWQTERGVDSICSPYT